MDWVEPHGPWDDQLACIFDGGVVDDSRAAALRPHDEELSELVFAAYDESRSLLPPRLARRFEAAVEAVSDGRMRYLRNGIPIW
ncbi:hypothetical protein AB0I49_09110 [Streptomyces sp. NPDC050617]|uniref:hypothetical protein n=1 Tax=Streptomyces sp. NPDC050617 TaxID=3154628 RepID=UPI00344125A7